MAELGFKSKQSGSKPLNIDAILTLKKKLKTLIYYKRMPGNIRINPTDLFFKKREKEKEDKQKEKKGRRLRKPT